MSFGDKVVSPISLVAQNGSEMPLSKVRRQVGDKFVPRTSLMTQSANASCFLVQARDADWR